MNRPMGNERYVQPSALTLSGLRHVDLQPQDIASVTTDDRQKPWTGTCEFVIETPEVRCRVLGAILWVPDQDNPDRVPDDYWQDLGGGVIGTHFGETSLWLAKREQSPLGGGFGHIPVENLAGTIFAPLPIPEVGCMGYQFELETSGEQVWGRMYVDALELIGGGRWVLKCACDAVQDMSEMEWHRVHSRFSSRVIGGLALNLDIPG